MFSFITNLFARKCETCGHGRAKHRVTDHANQSIGTVLVCDACAETVRRYESGEDEIEVAHAPVGD